MDYQMVLHQRRVAIVALMWEGEGRIRNRRRWQVHPIGQERPAQGDFFHLMRELRLGDDVKYLNFLRMQPWMFERLLRQVGPLLQRTEMRRDTLTPAHRLALTIRYLASGDSMTSLHYSFRVGLSTVSLIVRETCEALWTVLRGNFLVPNEGNWRRLARDFEERYKFPHCIGAIDGKHVVVQALPNSGSEYYNYKGQHSIVLLAVCDASNKFTMVDIGAQGRHSDGGIFSNSVIGQNFINGVMDLPNPDAFHPNYEACPYFLVGDEAFGLKDYLMRPYAGRSTGRLSREKHNFNYRLSLARKTIECTFGIMASRWRVLRKPITASEETVVGIVKATVVLHNFMREMEDEGEDRQYSAVSPEDMEGLFNGPGPHMGCRNHSQRAVRVRDMLAKYFCTEGRLN